MNAPVLHEHLVGRHGDPQNPVPPAAEGVERHVWQSRYGSMLIEVRGEEIRVNGQLVERAPPRTAP